MTGRHFCANNGLAVGQASPLPLYSTPSPVRVAFPVDATASDMPHVAYQEKGAHRARRHGADPPANLERQWIEYELHHMLPFADFHGSEGVVCFIHLLTVPVNRSPPPGIVEICKHQESIRRRIDLNKHSRGSVFHDACGLLVLRGVTP
ncbi:MAG: hypothetical protein WCD51_00275, partial [Anaerolineae bacterium]